MRTKKQKDKKLANRKNPHALYTTATKGGTEDLKSN
jgi:hypothetical protein